MKIHVQDSGQWLKTHQSPRAHHSELLMGSALLEIDDLVGKAATTYVTSIYI